MNVIQSWQLVGELCSENLLINQMMQNQLSERMSQCLQINHLPIQHQVMEVFVRLVERCPQYVIQLKDIIYEPNFITNISQPTHVDIIYSVLQLDYKVNLDKVHSIYQQILTIPSIQDHQNYQHKINFILSLAKGSNDPQKQFQLFIQAIQNDHQQLLNEDYLVLAVSKLQTYIN